jgi:hypothetical protein
VSAAAALAPTAAAPAVACDQPGNTTSPQSQQAPQSQQVRAKFIERGYYRHWHHHHGYRSRTWMK